LLTNGRDPGFQYVVALIQRQPRQHGTGRVRKRPELPRFLPRHPDKRSVENECSR
jgi:hypothetical protein